MNTNPNRSTHASKRRYRAGAALAGGVAALLATMGCTGSVVHNYRTFQSALDRGASCSELYDQRSRYDDEDTLAKMDRDLHHIGCTSPDATRND